MRAWKIGATPTRWAAVLAAGALCGAFVMSASVASAQVASTTTVVVRKVVTGTGTGPSTIAFTCDGTSAELDFHFDAQGNPTTTSPSNPQDVTIVNGAWQISGPTDAAAKNCHFSETATGGATSTDWTCTYSSTAQIIPTSQAAVSGCSAASGSGTGPVDVAYAASIAVTQQTSTVTFTNTFVAPPAPPAPPSAAPALVVAPTFTG